MENDDKLLDFAQGLECKKQQAINNNIAINGYGYFISRIINRAYPRNCCKKCDNNQLLMLHSDNDDKKDIGNFWEHYLGHIIRKKFLILMEFKFTIPQDITIEYVLIILFTV